MLTRQIKKTPLCLTLAVITFYAGMAIAGPKGCVTCDVRCSGDGSCTISNCKESPCS